MALTTFTKDPDAVLDYAVNWADWLVDTDTILTSEWIAEEGITIDSDTKNDTIATAFLSGGTVGTTYIVTNRITTVDGRTDDRSFKVKVAEK